ncbi:histidine kinase [Heliobacillus mobilis]|uniref:histidine kinase n=1 Tax=Heliobacterium mobile TaxID=28064 RepID=A0A6I3SGN3_HELMO|nr:PocR ligand-binding domain-containing protein [Heliobacterium mobile]MTV48001.1 histidine kinase [Heliobacterium mobile]
MEKYQDHLLNDIVDVGKLQEIQNKFAEATGLAAVIVDRDGRPVTEPSNFTSFCLYVRSTSEGLSRCMCSDDLGGRKAVTFQGAHVFRCHSGLTDVAAPIIVNGQYMGAFLAGQVVCADQDYDVYAEAVEKTRDLGLDREKVKETFTQLEVVPENKVKAAADLLYIMTNYIVEIGMVNIIQRQLMVQMKDKADLEKMLREAEIKALQSQINPHFLFNTLNTIARLALLEGATQTEEIVYALSDLLRHNLRNNRPMSILRSEINYIQSYLSIQSARFGDRIGATVDIPEELLDLQIPTMTLQPLVENAIIHGLEPKRGAGQISISAAEDQNRLLITIADTGIGIAANQVSLIFDDGKKRNHKHGQSHTTGLGIMNVHNRIQHYFGKEYGIEISGEPGKGTTVCIYLPVSRKTEYPS